MHNSPYPPLWVLTSTSFSLQLSLFVSTSVVQIIIIKCFQQCHFTVTWISKRVQINKHKMLTCIKTGTLYEQDPLFSTWQCAHTHISFAITIQTQQHSRSNWVKSSFHLKKNMKKMSWLKRAAYVTSRGSDLVGVMLGGSKSTGIMRSKRYQPYEGSVEKDVHPEARFETSLLHFEAFPTQKKK